MKPTEYEEFWNLYESEARLPLERACIHTARTKTDSTMDVHEMVAWIDSRVWKMLEQSAWPTFHDDPTPREATDRILKHAPTLARWAYLGLCRSHFRRLENRSNYLAGMSRAERLSMASSVDRKIEKREELDQAISSLRQSLSANEKQKLAASWIDKEDRSRVALVLGATRREDDRMITKSNSETMNKNTIEQMRSRARKRAQEVLKNARKLPLVIISGLLLVTLSFTSSDVTAGEQTGGRKGARSVSVEHLNGMHSPEHVSDGEQTGGRGPKP